MDSHAQVIERWLARFYGRDEPGLTPLEQEVLILLLDQERRKLKERLGETER